MTKKTKQIILSVTAVAVLAAVGTGLFIKVPFMRTEAYAKRHSFEPLAQSTGGDRIHFMNTQSADAILLESDGKFALIDAAEDSDNPRNFAELKHSGYEEKVRSYVKQAAGNTQGKVELEFIVGTHAHSDHIGGFDTLLADPDISVKQAYVKAYNAQAINAHEREKWDNQEVYDQMIDACRKRGVEVIHDIPEQSFQFGNFTITFYNAADLQFDHLVGENENSLGVLIEKDGKRVFLAGDVNNYEGAETQIAKAVGKVDLLKAGHHGYGGSTSKELADTLRPDIVILTNTINGMDKQVRNHLNRVEAAVYGTKEHNGIVAEFGADGISLYDGIHAN